MKVQSKTMILIPLFFILFFITPAFAGINLVDPSVSPSISWLHLSPSITISAKCVFDNGTLVENANVTAIIFDPFGIPTSQINIPFSGNKYTTLDPIQLSPSYSVGWYNVSIRCEYGSNTTEAFTAFEAKKLELEILGTETVEVYKGGNFTFSVIFKKYDADNMDGVLVTPSRDTFFVFLESSNIVFSLPLTPGYTPVRVGDHQEIMVSIPLSDSLPEGIYTLKIIGNEEGVNSTVAEKENYVKVNSPLKIDVDEEIKCHAETVCKKEIMATVVYYGGSISNFNQDNFEAVLMPANRIIDIEDVVCIKTTETCRLSITIPSLEAASYQLALRVEADEYYSEEWIPLDVLLPLSGEILDATGDVMETVITLENKDTGKVVQQKTDALGKYSIDVLPGNYDMEFKFPGATVKLYDVVISPETVGGFGGNLVRYDSFSGFVDIEGFSVAKIVVVEFALPFKNALINIPYDDRNVYDETKLEVHVCHNWNFGARRCVGEWETISSKVYTTKNMVEFNISNFSAFIVGERKFLHFYTLALSKEECTMGETIGITGKVLDSDGNAVEDAIVEFIFPEFNITSSTITTAGGVFDGAVTVPYKEGIFKLLIQAKKNPYISKGEEKIIKVTKSKGISIIVPDVVDVFIDQPTDVDFTILNSGQTNLTNVRVYVSGISSDWYQLVPMKINNLAVNEQKKVTMKIVFTSDQCGEKCKEYYLVTIRVKAETERGEEVDAGGDFTLKFLPPAKTEDEKSFIPISLPSITGFFALPKGIDTYYLLLVIITISAFTLGIFRKKKKITSMEISGRIPRESIASRIRRIRSEIKKMSSGR